MEYATDSTAELTAEVARALAEDIGAGDVTAQAVVAPGALARGVIVARQPGVISGLAVAGEVFRQMEAALDFASAVSDGERVASGARLATITGGARGILGGERTALNFMQRLSGIATLTASFVERMQGSTVRILDTRKTTPGLRRLEKIAVAHGGGTNHRMGLFDAVMIKDNHLAVAGGAAAALAALGRRAPGLPVIFEVHDMQDLALALNGPVDQVMLDNFTPEQVAEAVARIRRAPDRSIKVEVSGGITLENVAAYALEGVDFISVGALTHSAPALDIALDMAAESVRDE